MTHEAPAHAPAVGSLVVVDDEPRIGVCRLERIVDGTTARLLQIATGDFLLRPLSSLRPCPPMTPVRGSAPVT